MSLSETSIMRIKWKCKDGRIPCPMIFDDYAIALADSAYTDELLKILKEINDEFGPFIHFTRSVMPGRVEIY